jgi:hypothetical protein
MPACVRQQSLPGRALWRTEHPHTEGCRADASVRPGGMQASGPPNGRRTLCSHTRFGERATHAAAAAAAAAATATRGTGRRSLCMCCCCCLLCCPLPHCCLLLAPSVCSVTWQPPAAPEAGVSVLLQTQGEGVLACQARACARTRVAPLPCALPAARLLTSLCAMPLLPPHACVVAAGAAAVANECLPLLLLSRAHAGAAAGANEGARVCWWGGVLASWQRTCPPPPAPSCNALSQWGGGSTLACAVGALHNTRGGGPLFALSARLDATRCHVLLELVFVSPRGTVTAHAATPGHARM